MSLRPLEREYFGHWASRSRGVMKALAEAGPKGRTFQELRNRGLSDRTLRDLLSNLCSYLHLACGLYLRLSGLRAARRCADSQRARDILLRHTNLRKLASGSWTASV